MAACLTEIFGNGKSGALSIGAIPHVRYKTDQVPVVMEAAAKAGYAATDVKGNPAKKPMKL